MAHVSVKTSPFKPWGSVDLPSKDSVYFWWVGPRGSGGPGPTAM